MPVKTITAEIDGKVRKITADIPEDATQQELLGAVSQWDAAQAKPAPEKSWLDPVADYAKGVWSQTNPVSLGKSMAQSALHPLDTAKGIVDAQGALASKSKEAFEKGDYMTGLRHAVEYLIPVLGPQVSAIGDKAASGKVAEALGETSGLAAVLAGPKALSAVKPTARIGPLVKSQLTPPAAEAVALAERERIPIPASVATGNQFLQTVERTAEKTLPGNEAGTLARQKIGQAMTQTGERLANRASARPAGPETAGAALKTRIEGRIRGLKEQADTAYGEFRSAAENPRHTQRVQVDTKNVKGFDPTTYEPVMKKIPVTEDVALPVDVRELKTRLAPVLEEMSWMPAATRASNAGYTAVKKIMEGPNVISAVSAEHGLSGLKDLAREAVSADLRTEGQGLAAGIIPELQTKIDAAAAKAGVSRQLQQGRAAHALKMEAADVLGKLSEEPVQTFGKATYANDAGIAKLRELKKWAPAEMQEIGRAYLEKAFTKATEEGGFGHGAKIYGDWQKLGPETKKILYPNPLLRRDLDSFFLLGKKLAEQPNPSMTAVVHHSLKSAELMIMNPLTGIPYAIGVKGLTKLLYSPSGVRLLTKGMQIPVSNRVTAAATASALLRRLGDEAQPVNRPEEGGALVPALAQ